MAVAKRSAVTRHLPIAVPCGQNLVDHAGGRRLGLLEERDIERGVARKLAPWLIELMHGCGDRIASIALTRPWQPGGSAGVALSGLESDRGHPQVMADASR
jgi:hypothetical protein